MHVNDIKPYRYQPELKQKLILREEQIDLIDILTAEMDVLMDDMLKANQVELPCYAQGLPESVKP